MLGLSRRDRAWEGARLAVLWCMYAWTINIAEAQRYLIWSETFGNRSTISAISVRETGWHSGNNVAERTVYTPTYSSYGSSSITSLGYLHSKDLVFWSDAGSRCLYNLHIDLLSKSKEIPDNGNVSHAQHNSSQPEMVFCGTSGFVGGLAVDWLSGAVYWTDRAYRTISVLSYKNGWKRTLIDKDLDKPGGIAVDPINGYMIWCEGGQNPRIERADLQGRNRTALVSSGITEPTDITIDFQHSKIYFMDKKYGTVQVMDLDGQNRKVLFRHVTSGNKRWVNTVGISVAQRFVYASSIINENEKMIRIYGEFSGEWLESIVLKGTPYDVIFYDTRLQPTIPSDCLLLSCDHICISTGNGNSTCACADGYTLRSEKRCIGPSAKEVALPPDDISMAWLALGLLIVLAACLIAILIWIVVLVCRQWRKNRPPPSEKKHEKMSSLYGYDRVVSSPGSDVKCYPDDFKYFVDPIVPDDNIRLHKSFGRILDTKPIKESVNKVIDKEEQFDNPVFNDSVRTNDIESTSMTSFQHIDSNISEGSHICHDIDTDNISEATGTKSSVMDAPSSQEIQEIESTLALMDQALEGQAANRDSACVDMTKENTPSNEEVHEETPIVQSANGYPILYQPNHEAVGPKTSSSSIKSTDKINKSVKGLFKSKKRPTTDNIKESTFSRRRKQAIKFKDFTDPEQDRYAKSGQLGSLSSDPYRARRYWKSNDYGPAMHPGLAWKPRLSRPASGFSPASHGVPIGTLVQTLRTKSPHKQMKKLY